MRMADRHPDRRHQARGLCAQCYMREYDHNFGPKGLRISAREGVRPAPAKCRLPPRPAAPRQGHVQAVLLRRVSKFQAATCHPDKPHLADGLCAGCYSKRRYELDPEAARRVANESHQRMHRRNREEMLEAYGGKCACPRCPETNPAFLTLEHINGDGAAHRKAVGRGHAYADLRRRGWPKEGYTLLCMNCNFATRGGKTCPHMEADLWVSSRRRRFTS